MGADPDTDKNRSDVTLSRVQRLRESLVDVEEARVKLVIFELSGRHYAFYGSEVHEILPWTTIYYVPGAPDAILGVINLRGRMESVITINKFLDLPDIARTQNSRIAIATGKGLRSGILVDAIEDIIDVAVSAIKPPLATIDKAKSEFVTGELSHNGKDIILLDLSALYGKITV